MITDGQTGTCSEMYDFLSTVTVIDQRIELVQNEDLKIVGGCLKNNIRASNFTVLFFWEPLKIFRFSQWRDRWRGKTQEGPSAIELIISNGYQVFSTTTNSREKCLFYERRLWSLVSLFLPLYPVDWIPSWKATCLLPSILRTLVLEWFISPAS